MSYFNPQMTTSMTRKELKELLLKTEGWTFYNGYVYDICSKHLGAGIYRVWGKKRG